MWKEEIGFGPALTKYTRTITPSWITPSDASTRALLAYSGRKGISPLPGWMHTERQTRRSFAPGSPTSTSLHQVLEGHPDVIVGGFEIPRVMDRRPGMAQEGVEGGMGIGEGVVQTA